ncbi:DUF1501 domain-containing protein [Curvibacter sp. APW13]|uniref:DUF1501 domain-containing protein n=1 Tax=Curvibacter sp. APW13 TaxID=3077236 RepID=UPI0028DFC8B1|nr:DUF1501 domain-containing protein [Curvibacter sp. APW13]MDT8990069.1 DUF1501 domain-containing protein [Curvibacter sp. APW13]
MAHPPHDLDRMDRRSFLRRGAAGAALPWLMKLGALGEAAAFNGGAAVSDYKALVCVFLYGGNDYANTVITLDTPSYNQYSTIRGGTAGIAIAQSALAATTLNPLATPQDLLGVNRQYALHPSMTGVANLFNTGKAAVLLNVGPLVKPLTKAQYQSSNVALYPRPPQLFSHNDQQSVWQSSSAEGSKVGWGGRIGDRVLGHSSTVNTQSLFTCMSVTGNAVLLSGDTALQYQVSTSGAIKIQPATNATVYGSAAVASALNALVRDTTRTHRLERDHAIVTDRALTAESLVSTALNAPTATGFTTVFPTSNSLADQLKMVARLIRGRNELGAKRQVFLVSLGGFDLHDNLISQHPGLLDKMSSAMTAFYNATVEMGVANQVTAFTGSDFGRTLASNGDGSDHGWGGHHFIVGGAVNGQRFYGTPPPVSVGSTSAYADQWHVGQGRLLPTTSVDQYAATLARWFGVDDSEMATVVPNIANYPATGGFDLAWAGGTLNYPRYLGFLP